MNGSNSNLWLCSLTAEQKARTCGYWYTVTTGATPHTAFRTRQALDKWLSDRGLRLSAELPPIGTHAVQRLEGEYFQIMHGSYDEFYSLPAIGEIRLLSNGQYTLGRITEQDDGIRAVHTLNPNCKHRPVFDYRTSAAVEDAGANDVNTAQMQGIGAYI